MAVLNGTNANETFLLVGGDFTTTNDADTITPGGGTDTVEAAGGDDTVRIQGSDNVNDTLDGGDGTDLLDVFPGGGDYSLRGFNDGVNVLNFEAHDGDNKNLLGTNDANVFDFSGVTFTRVRELRAGGGEDEVTGSDLGRFTRYDLGSGDDTFTGGSQDETVIGGQGEDMISTGGGNDTINGGTNDDTIDAGAGDDVVQIVGSEGKSDTVDGGDGYDELDVIPGGGDYELQGFNDGVFVANFEAHDGDNKNLQGTNGANTFDFSGVALSRVRTLFANAGDDVVTGSELGRFQTYDLGSGDDTFNGSAQDETVIGGQGNDVINTGDGNDQVTGGTNDDTVDLGKGDDTYIITDANEAKVDTVNGGNGFDTFLNNSGSNFQLRNFNDGVQVRSMEFIDGKNRFMLGDNQGGVYDFEDVGFNRFNGLQAAGGEDTVVTSTEGNANNLYDGGNANDTIIVAFKTAQFQALSDPAKAGLFAYLDNPTGQFFDGSVFGFDFDATNFENGQIRIDGVTLGAECLNANLIVGTNGNDSLPGTNGNDLILGLKGNDEIDAGDGDDCVIGGNQKDTITGGTGVDELFGGQDDDTFFVRRFDGEFDKVDGGINDDTVAALGSANVNLIFDNFGAEGQYLSIETVDMNAGSAGRELNGNNNDNIFDFRGTEFIDGLDSVGMKNGDDTLYASDKTSAIYKGDGGDDTMIGSRQEDIFLGGDGDDTISGNNGVDTINGERGNDILSGGDRGDLFIFGGTGFGVDTITDWDGNRPGQTDKAEFLNTARDIGRFDENDDGVIDFDDIAAGGDIEVGADSITLVFNRSGSELTRAVIFEDVTSLQSGDLTFA